MIPLPPSLRARVLEDARATRSAKTPLAAPVALALAAAWVVLFALWHGRRENFRDLPTTAAWLPLALFVIAAGLAAAVSLAAGTLMIGPPIRRVLWSLSIPVLATATLALAVPNTTPSPAGKFATTALACDLSVAIVALPILVFLLLGQRGRLFPSPALVGAGAGVAAATFALAVLHWACPWTDLGHVLWGHVLPAVPLTFLGAAILRKMNRTSLAPRL